MTVIFKGNAEYCFSDHLNHWLDCFVIVNDLSGGDEQAYSLQLWANEADYENCQIVSGKRQSVPDIFNFDRESEECDIKLVQTMIFETVFTNNTCVVGKRDSLSFMKGSLLPEVLAAFPEDMFFVATTDLTINFRGANAAYLTHQLQYKRFAE